MRSSAVSGLLQSIPQLLSLASRVYKGKVELSTCGFELMRFIPTRLCSGAALVVLNSSPTRLCQYRAKTRIQNAHRVMGKDAPEFGVDNSDDVCDFINQYVSCKVPAEDGKLKDLVLLLQNHKHSSYCRRKKTCRFSFPKPPSAKTLITKDDPECGNNNQELAVLSKVQKLIADGNTDFSLAE